jgi:hypothetical protein
MIHATFGVPPLGGILTVKKSRLKAGLLAILLLSEHLGQVLRLHL